MFLFDSKIFSYEKVLFWLQNTKRKKNGEWKIKLLKEEDLQKLSDQSESKNTKRLFHTINPE